RSPRPAPSSQLASTAPSPATASSRPAPVAARWRATSSSTAPPRRHSSSARRASAPPASSHGDPGSIALAGGTGASVDPVASASARRRRERGRDPASAAGPGELAQATAELARPDLLGEAAVGLARKLVGLVDHEASDRPVARRPRQEQRVVDRD